MYLLIKEPINWGGVEGKMGYWSKKMRNAELGRDRGGGVGDDSASSEGLEFQQSLIRT